MIITTGGVGAEAKDRTIEATERLDPKTAVQWIVKYQKQGRHVKEGVRIGVQEMTRFGMGEEEMVRIAELIKECVIEKKLVKEEVNRFRSEYQEVKYSFDELAWAKPELVDVKVT